MQRKLRMGMVGGGKGAFIGAVHRMAAQLDGLIELCCGVFSSNAARSLESGRELMLPDDRVYGSHLEMIQSERMLPDHQRMDFVAIVTPNDQHYPVARLALQHGFHVVCDKPMTLNLDEAVALERIVAATGLEFALTHNYTGYPLVKEARHLVEIEALGRIRKVVVEYPQGWLATRLEAEGQKQASWRTDPKRAGASCCMGDIGTHAANLAEYITGLDIAEVCADLTTFVAGRPLEDDGNVLLRFDGGARGVLTASQVSIDDENGLAIRIYGERGGLEWRQEEPNTLIHKQLGAPRQILRAGVNHTRLSKAALHNTRLPGGHPEGYIEAFANVYRNFALTLAARAVGRTATAEERDFPGAREGVRGMAFIAAVVESAHSAQKWVRIPELQMR
ncbi:MAG: Gfo/Idh/MocA family protein [Planctomycetota bacterium]